MIEPESVIPPLVVEFEVAATAEHAFATWVERTELWWPRTDTVSGQPTAIVFEPRVGGRIYERGPDGDEHPWGEVLVWDPPARLECLWHLFFPRAEATRLCLTFTPRVDSTLVRLEQSGWAALGEQGPRRRARTTQGWAAVSSAFRGFIDGHEER